MESGLARLKGEINGGGDHDSDRDEGSEQRGRDAVPRDFNKRLGYTSGIGDQVWAHKKKGWATVCLEKVGVPPPEAKLVASSLVQTSVWGIDSHGVLRLTHYLNRMTIGSISPSAAPVV